MRKTRLLVLGLAMIALLLSSSVSAGSRGSVENNLIRIYFKADKAYYTDADSDGKADDVLAYFHVKIRTCDDDGDDDDDDDDDDDSYSSTSKDLKVKLHLRLELPSGKSFSYIFEYNFYLRCYDEGLSKKYIAYFIDHALESGWYVFVVGYELQEGGYDYDEAEIVFDPPGENEGAPPPAYVEEM